MKMINQLPPSIFKLHCLRLLLILPFITIIPKDSFGTLPFSKLDLLEKSVSDGRDSIGTSDDRSSNSSSGIREPETTSKVRDTLIEGIHDANTIDAQNMLKESLMIIDKVNPRTHFITRVNITGQYQKMDGSIRRLAKRTTEALGMSLETYAKDGIFGQRKGDVVKKTDNPGNIFYYAYYKSVEKGAQGNGRTGGLTKKEALAALEVTIEKLYSTQKEWKIAPGVADGNRSLALFVVKKASELQVERNNAP